MQDFLFIRGLQVSDREVGESYSGSERVLLDDDRSRVGRELSFSKALSREIREGFYELGRLEGFRNLW